MSAHTKGTWRQGGDGSAVFSGARFVASVFPMRDENAEELEANVRLIAAAPELLEALSRYIQQDEQMQLTENNLYRTAKAAIAKATGEQA
jgi:NADH dehydrogenase FAD-containing subunit